MMIKEAHKRAIDGRNRIFYVEKSKEYFVADNLDVLCEKYRNILNINHKTLVDFINQGLLSPNSTFYENIKRVPPGFELYKEGGKLFIRRWWDPLRFTVDRTLHFDTFTARFRELFEQAVERGLPDNNTPVACELSGGFDSSSVFCIASRKHPKILALTMDFHDPKADERSYARAAYRHCQSSDSELIAVRPETIDYRRHYNMHYNYELNPHWPIWVTFTMYAPMLEVLLERNIHTVLTGQMGDHLLSGDPRAVENYLHRKKYLSYFHESIGGDISYSSITKSLKRLISFSLGERNRTRIKKLLGKEVNIFPSGDKDWALDDFDNLQSPDYNSRIIKAFTSPLFHMYVDSIFSQAVTDRYGIRFYSPFGDQELVEFMLTVPPEYIHRYGNHRHFHAQCMDGILPPEIIERRSKAEFSTTIRRQMEAIDRQELWKDPTIVKMGLTTDEELKALEQKFLIQSYTVEERRKYWRMINVEYWYALNPYLDKSEFPPNPYIMEGCD